MEKIDDRCDFCGAPHPKSLGFGKFHCEYCGMEYVSRDLLVKALEDVAVTVSAEEIIDERFLDRFSSDRSSYDRELFEYATDLISKKLANAIKPYLFIVFRKRTIADPLDHYITARGELRILPKDLEKREVNYVVRNMPDF